MKKLVDFSEYFHIIKKHRAFSINQNLFVAIFFDICRGICYIRNIVIQIKKQGVIEIMQLLLIVLNKTEKLDELLESLIKQGISGATILNSVGMIRELSRNNEYFPIIGSLRYLIDPERTESKTIFLVLKDEQIEKAKEIIRKTVGDLSKPDTAIVFTLPVLSAEGIGL